MTILNIRGTSGSGKSTLVKRFLEENKNEPIELQLSDWKKPKIAAYKVFREPFVSYTGYVRTRPITYVVGPYRTQCGGCDALSYKGSHEDIEKLVREFASQGNVIFEGLTISSTVSRWQRISDAYPGRFIWAFMMTPEDTCHERILGRSGREPKRQPNGLADYQIKYRGCMRHLETLKEQGEQTLELTSDNEGYEAMLKVLG